MVVSSLCGASNVADKVESHAEILALAPWARVEALAQSGSRRAPPPFSQTWIIFHLLPFWNELQAWSSLEMRGFLFAPRAAFRAGPSFITPIPREAPLLSGCLGPQPVPGRLARHIDLLYPHVADTGSKNGHDLC